RDRVLAAVRPGIGDGGAEEDLAQRLLLPRIDQYRAFEPLGEITHSPVDLSQPLLAIEIVRVLGTVAVARRPADDLDDPGTLLLQPVPKLGLQRRMTRRRDIVLGTARQRVIAVAIAIVGIGIAFPGEGFAHGRWA